MNSQDLRNLQEAYMEVYGNGLDEGRVPWNDSKNPNPSGYTPKEKSKAKRKQLGVDDPDTTSFEKGGPGEKEYARHGNLAAAQEKMEKKSNQPKGKLHQFKKNPFWKMDLGQVRRQIFGTNVPKNKRSSYQSSKKGGPFFAKEEAVEQIDLYDIILSHLLDEGYAETPEAAEVMMVNMSEEWREDIVEGYKELPVGKMDAKAKELTSKFLKSKPGSPEAKKLISRASQITGTRDSIVEVNVSKEQQQKDAKTREKWYGKKSIERGTDRFSQLQKKAIESGKTKLF